MRTLFIDTSTQDVSIAVIEDNNILYSKTSSIPNEHSIYTVPYIKEAFKKCLLIPDEMNELIVVNGPGSWTGIRIGLTIAKTYGYALNKKVKTISSLKAVALSTRGEVIISILPAQNDNYYFGVYDESYNEIGKEQHNTKEELMKIINSYENKTIVSLKSFNIDNINVEEITFDYKNIVSYLKKSKNINIHSITGNYLKLPQALEDKK